MKESRITTGKILSKLHGRGGVKPLAAIGSILAGGYTVWSNWEEVIRFARSPIGILVIAASAIVLGCVVWINWKRIITFLRGHFGKVGSRVILVTLVAFALGVLILAVLMINPCGDVTVYVTETGNKYHKADCIYLSRSKTPMSLCEASKKYQPCLVCKPPKL